MVAYVLYTVTVKIGVAAENKIYSKHGRGLANGVLAILFSKNDVQSLFKADWRSLFSFFLKYR